jgi:Tfp pilus assembly protein PilX
MSKQNLRRQLANNGDDGAILPMVLVMSVVVSLVIVALAGYVSTNLRYGDVVEERADRLAAADGGLRFAVERLQTATKNGQSTTMTAIVEVDDQGTAAVNSLRVIE